MGFRNAASQRAKFGKGIYAAANVWEALAYAQPETHSLVQTFLVADLWQGPSRVGHENMIDFGQNASAKQILTTTNPEETISALRTRTSSTHTTASLCAARSSNRIR
jgi:hypothetical protein